MGQPAKPHQTIRVWSRYRLCRYNKTSLFLLLTSSNSTKSTWADESSRSCVSNWLGIPVMSLICFMWFNEQSRLQLARGRPHRVWGRYPCSLAESLFPAPAEPLWHVSGWVCWKSHAAPTLSLAPPSCSCNFAWFLQPLIKGEKSASDVSFISLGSLEGIKMKGTYVMHLMMPLPLHFSPHNCPPHTFTKCTVSSCLQTQ